MHFTEQRRWSLRTPLIVLLSFVLTILSLPLSAPSAMADTDAELSIESYVAGHQGEIPTFAPGDSFSYTVNLQCSAATCANAAVSATLPSPLVFNGSDAVIVSPAIATVTLDGQNMTVTFNNGGLEAGKIVAITVKAMVPTTASADKNGTTATTTFTATADNADTVSDSAAVTLDIPQKLAAKATKSVAPTTTQPAISGRPVTFTLGGANTSNVRVDSIVIADPADAAASNPFDTLELTDITTLTAPAGADRVAFSWYDGTDWHNAVPIAVPADPTTLLAGITLGDIHGVRFTFTKDGETLPAGDPASIVLTTAARDDAFTGLGQGDQVTVTNKASVSVVSGSSSASDTAQASVTFEKRDVQIDVAKSFDGSSLVAGKTTTATITAETGVMTTSSITINEPGDSGPDLAAQGLTFGAFVTDSNADPQLTWPDGASTASITYHYTDGTFETLSTSSKHTLPAPNKAVAGFSVTFTSTDPDGIEPHAEVVLPFTVTANAVTVEGGTTATNKVTATATGTAGTATDTASAPIILLPERVRTSLDKAFNKSAIWASAGSAAAVELTGKVSSDSTVGSEHLTITDNDTTFWDHVDLTKILPTDVPSNAVMTVEYWDGTAWQQLTAPVTGPQDGWTYKLSDAQRALVQGIRFTFTPKTAGDLLPPGFTVVPRFQVALRKTLRSSETTSATEGIDTLTNNATSEVANPHAIVAVVTDGASDDLTLKPVGGGGGGSVDLAAKDWLDPDTGAVDNNPSVSALSDDQRTAAVRWGTGGLSMSSVEVVDDPNYASIASSAYNAFNLVRIQQITTATDPSIATDKVTAVALYDGSGWTDITGTVCATAAACDGGFPGYTLSPTEQETTRAVRLTFAAGSASDTGAVTTTGEDHDRTIKLDYQLRRTLRSNATAYVLGTSHSYTYNSGDPGVVRNNVQVTGTLTTPLDSGATNIQSVDSADITIYDRPLNVNFTKKLDQTALGIPQNSGDIYPLVSATLTATNTTASGVPEIDIADPADGATPLSWYRYFGLYSIEFSALPDGLSGDDVSVVLTRLSGGTTSTETMTYAQAVAASATDLATVVGVRVVYGAAANLADPAKPLIPSAATAAVVLTYQLRSTLRADDGSNGTAMPATSDVTNVARASVISAGGIGCTAQVTDCDSPTTTDSGSIDIAQPSYSVAAGKTIAPSSRYEDQSADYNVTITGQPTGTARTQVLTLTDATPTFWNAFDLKATPTVTLPTPTNQLRMWVLTGVTYGLDNGTLVATCSGTTDLTACWHPTDWQDADTAGTVNPSLPFGISAPDVRGVRFEVRRVVNGTPVQWERPADPKVSITLPVTRRAFLVYGTNGATDTPVPSTLPGMATAPGEAIQGVTTDQVQVDGLAAWRTQTGTAYTGHAVETATTKLLHRVNEITVQKTPGQGTDAAAPRFDLDATIPYQVKITNSGAWSMTGLAITDQIGLVGNSSPLVPADVDPAFTFTVGGTAVGGFSASLDTNTGDLAVVVPSGFVLKAGQTLLITTNLRFRDRLAAGTVVTNTVNVASDRDFEKCSYTTDAQAQTPTTDVTDCSSSTTVVAAASTPISVSKSVKGNGAGDPAAAEGKANHDDLGVIAVGATTATACASPDADGFYTYPCTPITRPGGTETWRLSLSNNGNVAANIVSAIDVLPAPGDTGVIVSTARKSRFATTFLGKMTVTGLNTTAQHTLTYYYSTTAPSATCNKADILNDTKPGGQSNCGITWIPFTNATDADTLATARAIKVLLKFDDEKDGLEPGDPLTVTFDTRTPASSPVADSSTLEPIAWNSMAVGARTADSTTYPARASLVTEPRKVGVAIASGQLDLSKTVVAPSGATWLPYLPTTYDATITCTSLGKKVALVNSSGKDVSTVTLAADGTVANYNSGHTVNLPWNSTCGISEDDPGTGATATTSADVTALRSYSGIANVANGWTGGSTAALNVTNTYPAAGFTVSKAVPSWPAQYADGSAVVFKDFTYTASCTFLGHEVLAPADQTFSLRDGDSKQFTVLPTGADCTVTETYAAGADSTTVTTSQGGSDVNTGTKTTTFTLVPGGADATSVAYTNTFKAGSVTVTKAITGAGAAAWGDQQFTVQLVCTHPDAKPAEVYRATKTLSRATTLTWTVDHLAGGASCTVTEPQNGGATATTITGGTFTVDAATPAAVTVTNRFGTGSVSVTKTVRANGVATSASPWADGVFPVTLTCTRQVNGTTIGVTVPGDATRTLAKGNPTAWTATWDGLPTNASCSVAENVAGITGVTGQPDPTVTVSPASVTVPDAAGTATIGVVNDYRAGKLKITKTLLGAGSSFFTGATFSVTCTLGAATVVTKTGISVPAGTLTPAEVGPIPFGASCTVAETATGGADATPAPQVVTVTMNDATSDVTTVNFTNAFSAGTLTVTKVLAGEAANATWAIGATFVIKVSCGVTATPTFTQTVTIVGPGSTTLMDGASPKLFPVGTRCWASETTTGGATSSVVSATDFDSGVIVTTQSDPTVAQALGVTATNTYSYAGLTVSKKADGTDTTADQDGKPLTYPSTAAFNATCKLDNGTGTLTVLNTNFSLAMLEDVWTSTTFDKLPSGASCKVTETKPGWSPTMSYRVTRSPNPNPNPDLTGSGTGTTLSTPDFSLVTGGVGDNTAAFTNTFTAGSLKVTKTLSPTTPLWADHPFALKVVCTISGTTVYTKETQFNLTSGSLSLDTITKLPTGASCTTTETRNGGGTPAWNSQTRTIGNGNVVTTGVTNTFATGSVQVEKILKVNGVATSAEPWASASYTVKLTCTRVVDGGPVETLDLGASATKTLTRDVNGRYLQTWKDLPQGANCSATETAINYPANTPAQPAPTVTYSPTQAVGVNVGNGTTVAQTVTNDFAFGSVQIVKSLAGDAANDFGNGTFTFSVSCTLDGTTGTVFSKTGITLSKASGLTSSAIGPIPKGSICTVTETGTAGATSVAPAPKTIVLDAIEAGGTRMAAFTNTFDYAGFTVTKAVTNSGAVDQDGKPIVYAATYHFSATCTFNGSTVLNVADFTLQDGTSQAFKTLPVGASCTVVETNTGNAHASSTITQNGTAGSTTDGATSATFTLVAGTSPLAGPSPDATVVAYTDTYTVGGLEIAKTVTGSGAAAWGAGPFRVSLVCTLDHDANTSTAEITVFNATHNLTGGATWSVGKLPTAAHCTISEPKNGGANATTISLPTPTITTAAQAVTVTNTFNTGSVQVTKAIANGLGTLSPWKDATYEFTLACTKDFDGDGTAESFTVPNAVKTVTGPGSATWTGLPQGATCAATETNTTYPANTPSQPAATVTSSGNVTVGNNTTVAQSLTNTFSTARVNIAKTIVGTGATAWGTGPFTFSVQCTLSGSGSVFGTTVTLTPTAGQTSLTSADLSPIPQGSTCTVTETDAAGASPVVPSSKVVTLSDVPAGATTTASFTNTFDLAGFTVTKAVTSDAVDAAGQPIAYDAAHFTASCMFRGSEVITATADAAFTLAAGATKTFTGLPTGASCTVTESGTSGAASTAVVVTQGTSTSTGTTSATFTLTPGGAAATSVAFTNHYTTGSLKITKTVAGAGAALWGGGTFTARVVCTLTAANPDQVFDTTGTLSKASPTWTIANLPTGASCTVTETKNGGANSTSISNGTPTIGNGTTVETGITNTFTLGAVRVTKALTVDGVATTAKPWTQGSYTVALACTRDFNNDGVAEAITIPGNASRTITGAASATYADLPTGASCTVTETASSPLAQGTTISPSGVVTVGADPATPQTFTVTNDFHTATMSVLKQLEGAGQASFGAGPFTFSISCTLAGATDPVYSHTVTLTRASGSTATSLRQDGLGPVPVGAVCTVTETDKGGADATPAPVTLTIAGNAAVNVATFTNQFSAGTVWVTKTLAGAARGETWATGATFTVDVLCQAEVGGVRGTVFSREFSITGGQRLNVTDTSGNPSRVPLGSHCWISGEPDAQGATSTTITQHDWDSAAVVVAGTPSALQALELGLTNTYEYAGFTVSKTVDGGGAVDASGTAITYPASFAFHATCTFNGATVLNATTSLTDGRSDAFTGLPSGAACTVAETGGGNAASTSVTVTQDGTAGTTQTATSATFTLVRGSGANPADASVSVAAFTNHFTTGALTITKQLTGDGADAWGTAPFTVRLLCTLDTDDNPATTAAVVFDGTHQLSTSTSLTWSVANLATGASCAITETAAGGANSTTITNPTPTVGNQPSVPGTVTVTNRFTTGSVTVTKAVLVDGRAQPNAEPYDTAAFAVKLTCTRDVNGVSVPVDVPLDGYPVGDAQDGVRTIIGSGSYSYTGLPTGATCQVTEVGAAFPLPAAQVSIVQPGPVASGSTAALATVSNDYHTGTLQLVKALTGTGVPTWSGADFRFDVTCTLTDTSSVAHTVFSETGIVLNQVDGLSSPVYSGIPVGADCLATETQSGGADIPATTTHVTIVDQQQANIATLTNGFNVGSLKVTLGLTLDGAPTTADPFVGGRYDVQVTCTRTVNGVQEPVTITGGLSWSFTGPGEHTFTGLPVGASCSVSQTDASLTPQSVTYDPAIAGSDAGSGPVSIVPDGGSSVATLGVLDHFLTRTLVVTKRLAGDGAADHATHPFTLTVACTLAETGVAAHDVYGTTITLSVASGLVSAPLGPIPVGSQCVVAETGTGGATIPADPASVTITETGDNTVTLTNAFGTGTVRVTKAITVDGVASTAEPYASARYTVGLSCTQRVNGEIAAVAIPGGPTRVITGAGSVDFTGLPLTATCTVSEAGSTLAIPADQVTISRPVVTVGGDPVESVITNDFRTGSLVLNWTITGVGVQFAGPATFSVDCTLDGATGWSYHREVTLDPKKATATGVAAMAASVAASATFTPIPVGAACTVTQTDATGADRLSNVVVATGTVDLRADVVNEYSAGSLTITKRLAGGAASAHTGTTFRFTATCLAADSSTAYTGVVAIVGAGSTTITGDDGQPLLFPAGTTCWAVESETGGADTHTVDHDSAATGLKVVSGQPDAVQQLVVTAVNTFAATTDSDNLAYTGFAGAGIAGLGLGFVAVGFWLIRRRRA